MSLVDLGKRLLDAAKLGHTDEVRALMSNGAPFTTDWLGTSPLHFAAMNGHMDTAEVLLRAGISRDARTKVDRTPLHVASQEGHMEIVDLLVRNGADVEAKDMLKMTPLHWAVEKGHFPVIELLLQHGSDVVCPNKFDKSPIDIANFNGRTDIAELLLLHKQNIVEITTEQQVIEEVTATETVTAEMVASDNLIHHDHSPLIIKGEVDDDEEQEEQTEGGKEERNSTAVLATLAALAEATGPLSASTATTNATASEALSWLETHGITMISGGNTPTIMTSDPNQTLTLTEAGKLALNFVKQQSPAGVEHIQVKDVSQLDSENVITIVTDDLESGQVCDEEALTLECTEVTEGGDEPAVKRLRTGEDVLGVICEGEEDFYAGKEEVCESQQLEGGQAILQTHLEEVCES